MAKYWLIRCPNCRRFTYTDKYGKWKLCPLCGETINVSDVPIYLEVEDFSEAEGLIIAVESYLSRTGRIDLQPEEVALIRDRYTEWLKNG